MKRLATVIDHKKKEIVTVDEAKSGEIIMQRSNLKEGKRIDDFYAGHIRRAERTK